MGVAQPPLRPSPPTICEVRMLLEFVFDSLKDRGQFGSRDGLTQSRKAAKPPPPLPHDVVGAQS